MDSYLRDWAHNYVKCKELILKKAKEITLREERVIVKYPEKTISFIPMAQLKAAKVEQSSTIVTFNTRKNFDEIVSSWKELCQKKATIILINPLSKLDDKWVIAPYIHERVCDSKNLKHGLMSMFCMVDAISPADESKLSTTAP